jgi:hypothetical protein
LKSLFKVSFLFFLLFSLSILTAEQNVRLSFLKSALLPGWGELSNDNATGYVFLATEAMLWFSKYYYHNESKLYNRASKLHAIRYAHISEVEVYDEIYYDHLKRYMSHGFDSGGYNANLVLEAKYNYPDNLEAQQDYIQQNMYNDAHAWHWDSKDKQLEYRFLRKHITQNEDYSKAVTGFIILNHLVSAVNSARISSKLKHLEMNISLNREFTPFLMWRYQF